MCHFLEFHCPFPIPLSTLIWSVSMCEVGISCVSIITQITSPSSATNNTKLLFCEQKLLSKLAYLKLSFKNILDGYVCEWWFLLILKFNNTWKQVSSLLALIVFVLIWIADISNKQTVHVCNFILQGCPKKFIKVIKLTSSLIKL